MSRTSDAAQLASLSDETPEGRSIVVLAKDKYGLRGREVADRNAQFIPFTAQTRMSERRCQWHPDSQGASEAVPGVRSREERRRLPATPELTPMVDRIAKSGGTPLVVAVDGRVLGVIHLKDIVKGGIRERFIELRRAGIRTVMITGDNPMTAAAIAAEGGRR